MSTISTGNPAAEPQSIRRPLAAAAGLGLALAGGSATSAQAFFGLFSEPQRPAYTLQSAPLDIRKPAAPKPAAARRKRPAAETALPNELAGKAKGPLTIVVSLEKQQLTLYSGDTPIAHSRVSTGKTGHSTPAGVFSVIEKDRWHYSNLYDSAPMHFMHRITWSGVALHQGIVPNYPASHGCIRMPEAFARQLFGVTKLGARVIVARGEAKPAAITHQALFTPLRPVESVPVADAAQPAQPAGTKMAMLDAPAAAPVATDAKLTDPAATPVADKSLKAGAVSVFVSRKEGKLYVRKGFAPVFETPVTIARAAEPIGTHVFTALAVDPANGSAQWSAISVPSSAKAPLLDAAAALDRIDIPAEARARIAALMSPGASLVVSDHGLGPETGTGTDFIVLTR